MSLWCSVVSVGVPNSLLLPPGLSPSVCISGFVFTNPTMTLKASFSLIVYLERYCPGPYSDLTWKQCLERKLKSRILPRRPRINIWRASFRVCPLHSVQSPISGLHHVELQALWFCCYVLTAPFAVQNDGELEVPPEWGGLWLRCMASFQTLGSLSRQSNHPTNLEGIWQFQCYLRHGHSPL